MNESEQKRISKFLSLVLRHQPETIGVVLDENGWTDVSVLLEKMNAGDFNISFQDLQLVVENNDKKRFSFSDDLKRIRASQGHSIKVDLELSKKIPPDLLFHGTAEKNLGSIKEKGLVKAQRHHVHLSAEAETAKKVSMRYGKPVVLIINAKMMHENGIEFFLSENNVWLTDHVSPNFIQFP